MRSLSLALSLALALELDVADGSPFWLEAWVDDPHPTKPNDKPSTHTQTNNRFPMLTAAPFDLATITEGQPHCEQPKPWKTPPLGNGRRCGTRP